MTIRSNIFRCMAALTFMPVCIGCTSSLSVDNIEPNTSNEVVCFRDGTATDFQETSRAGIPVTRATSNLERSHKDFKVFGYNTVNGVDQVMMNNYKVYYVSESNKQADDNTVASDAGWSYLYDASGKAIENQGLKLWDKNASAYHFFAGSPIASTSDASLDSKTLTFSLKNTQNIAEAALYSTSQELTSSDYGKAVPFGVQLSSCSCSLVFRHERGRDKLQGQQRISKACFCGNRRRGQISYNCYLYGELCFYGS